jgi:hypothetical protein
VFRGGRHDQDGAVLGNILSGLFRYVAPIARHIAPYAARAARAAVPIAARGLTSFAQNTLSAHQQGVPLGEAAKAAILPALGDAAMALDKQIGGRRHAPPRKRANTSAVGAGMDQPSPPKRRRRAAPKRRQVGGGTKPPAKRRRKQAGGAKRRKQTGGAKRRAPAKRTGQKGGRKRVYKKRGGAKRKTVRFNTSVLPLGHHF